MKTKLCYVLCFFSFFRSMANNEQAAFSFEYIKGTHGWELSADFLKKINYFFDIDHFVETGTYKGWTAEAAAQTFKAVHSIELDDNLYEDATRKLKQYENVFLYHGDSKKILPDLCKKLRGTVLFWLDGHFSGDGTALGEEFTPLIFELKAIKESGLRNPLILIDDLRSMRHRCKNKVSGWQGYPFIEKIVAAIKSINKNYKIITMCDVLFAYMPQDNVTHSPVAEATLTSRLYNNDKKITLQNVLKAEQIIANASDKEKSRIAFHREHVIFREIYYKLWDGIIKLHQKNYTEAENCFSSLLSEGYDDKRIRLYLRAAKNKAQSIK